MRLGLAANRLHHATADAALFRWLRASGQGIRELGLELHAVGRTHDAIVAAGMLGGHAGLKRYPYGREGGLMKLVAEVVGMDGDARTLDFQRLAQGRPFRIIERMGDTRAIQRALGQCVGLRVAQHLQAVLQLAQESVGVDQGVAVFA